MPQFRRSAAPLGSRLLGDTTESPRRRRIRIQLLLTVFLVLSNLIGAVIVGVLISVVVPGPDVLDMKYYWWVNFIVVPVYVFLAFLVGVVWGTTRALSSLRWGIEDREPTRSEQVATLAMPWRLTRMQVALWTGGLILLTTIDGIIDPQAIPKVAFTIAAGGTVVCAFSYLLSEFALRPIAARALQAGDPRRIRIAGVMGRSILSWLLGTGVPVSGLMMIAVFRFLRPETSANQLAVSILALGGITIVFGFALTVLGGFATTSPINNVRAGMAEVEKGNMDVRLAVYDGTELGELQSGFNRMADGVRDREKIRDLFGRHVGHEVAEKALQSESELGGQERDIAVFFIDLVGSTELAASRPPTEVVDLLNRFFAVVVDEVDEHGGFINKFEGDAALAIFGAPNDIPDHCGSALSAARAIARRLLVEVPECSAAVGVAAGRAVAGNVGAKSRFEYTVIGDPVNEAARLSELAKSAPGAILASKTAVDGAAKNEADRWEFGDRVTLRGRSAETVLANPRDVKVSADEAESVHA
ncbi:adenylate/guanylate cyclase domain-containing protein [Rhodococcus sp. 06-1460-1B]|uniref:adenylate/guanylate cyclase domain-containing protein n=1 Tax=Rhodococcus sp. 06-1460-1B TaxID=2022501 RepID=UPI000B9C1ED1|nr:adenylate/guanylate cyclase domain-containing protein [Rhodococcus sp. 06-1460-1B]MBY4381280.1 adenylate/guanylate cyclase domain-containing protein [Rhodococcus fascians]MBY4396149.1 adenylate/guanylate cyclase domain-containing protein [Rhodococcus fascians]MBY4405773.1 adenylate/guanylate cyclase domain-containing protein [Rhodococcus fascians]MBY4421173.1 adenylate/guanylate cyclase domain-containing protein [Rhodococcus fascians]MBY4460004.1 adenylate/guanylate cyclase domain-containin